MDFKYTEKTGETVKNIDVTKNPKDQSTRKAEKGEKMVMSEDASPIIGRRPGLNHEQTWG